MKAKNLLLQLTLVSALVVGFSSCNRQYYVPKAINTINPVTFADLNLKRADYEILNTLTATGTVIYKRTYNEIKITEENNEFTIIYRYDKKKKQWYLDDVKNIVKLGFLANDYGNTSIVDYNAEDVCRRLAIYRLINESQMMGADGVIEPVVSTNIEQLGRDVVFKSTVSAKVVKLKTNN